MIFSWDRRLFGWIALLGLAITRPALVWAQAADMRFNLEIDVQPGQGAAFYDAWNVLRGAAEKHRFPYYVIMNEQDDRRYLVVSSSSFADVDTMRDFVSRFEKSADPLIAGAATRLKSAISGAKTYFSTHDLPASHAPEGSYSGPYHRIETFRYALNDHGAVRQLLLTRKAAWSAAKVLSAYHVLWNGIGAGGSSFSILTSAPTIEEHAKIDAQVAQVPGENAFRGGLWQIAQSVGVQFWLARPDMRIRKPQ